MDSRSNVLIRPGYPNQPGVQFRPPPRPGAPQFAQRPPAARPPLGQQQQQQQQYPANLGPRGPNVGIRPGTPYPRQPLPNTTPRPQNYTQSKPVGDQFKNLDSANILSHQSDETSDTHVTAIQNNNANQSVHKIQEDRTEIPDNKIRDKIEEYKTNRTDSKSSLYMNKIDEDESQEINATIAKDNVIRANPSTTEYIHVTKTQNKEDEKFVNERPSSAMRMSKTPSEERPTSALKSPIIEKTTDLSPRIRKVPNNFNGNLKSPKSGY